MGIYCSMTQNIQSGLYILGDYCINALTDIMCGDQDINNDYDSLKILIYNPPWNDGSSGLPPGRLNPELIKVSKVIAYLNRCAEMTQEVSVDVAVHDF